MEQKHGRKGVLLNVNGKYIRSTEITYEDLKILYQQFIETYGKVPIYAECDSKHNMPQGRIITRVLKENNVSYNDFLLKFGKVSHVRTESEDYDFYLNKFIQIGKKLGHALRSNELLNNSYGLPNPNWFVKNCPDKNIKSYDDFVIWCGFRSNKLTKDKDFVVNTLIKLEKELGRPIKQEDISLEKTGFSMIVINRLFGSLNAAKEELGLKKSVTTYRPFKYYKSKLDNTLDKIYKDTGRKFITWRDIESQKYNEKNLEHKTLILAFEREGLNIFNYIQSQGFEMKPSILSHNYLFEDGERTVSSMEYDFSKFLRSLGYKYKETYFRNVMYKTFSDVKSKMNCDYKIMVGDTPLYVEIAGMIYEANGKDWRTYSSTSKMVNSYREKLIKKESILNACKCNYIILLCSDMINENYKVILQKKMYVYIVQMLFF